jgi:hypothetical protein
MLLVVMPGQVGDADVRSVQMDGISDALQEARAWMDEISGVQGVGEGRTSDGQPCVNVYVVSKALVPKGEIPDQFSGFPVCVIDSGGAFQAQLTSQEP